MPDTPPSSLSFSRRSLGHPFLLSPWAAADRVGLLAACGSDEPAGRERRGRHEAVHVPELSPLETLSITLELLRGRRRLLHQARARRHPAAGRRDLRRRMQTMLAGIAPITRLGQMDVMTAIADTDQPLVNIGTSPGARRALRLQQEANTRWRSPKTSSARRWASLRGRQQRQGRLARDGQPPGSTPSRASARSWGSPRARSAWCKQGRIAGYVVSVDTANILVPRTPTSGCSTPPSTPSPTRRSTSPRRTP